MKINKSLSKPIISLFPQYVNDKTPFWFPYSHIHLFVFYLYIHIVLVLGGGGGGVEYQIVQSYSVLCGYIFLVIVYYSLFSLCLYHLSLIFWIILESFLSKNMINCVRILSFFLTFPVQKVAQRFTWSDEKQMCSLCPLCWTRRQMYMSVISSSSGKWNVPHHEFSIDLVVLWYCNIACRWIVFTHIQSSVILTSRMLINLEDPPPPCFRSNPHPPPPPPPPKRLSMLQLSPNVSKYP